MIDLALGFVAGWAVLALLYGPWFSWDIEMPLSREEFYENIRARLSWAPPAGVYGIVWTVLYLLIAISVGLFINDAANLPNNTKLWATFILICINIFTNKTWDLFFFEMRNIGVAALDAVLIFATAVSILVLFWVQGVNWFAIVSMFVYCLWTGFAMILTLAIARLGPSINSPILGSVNFDVNKL